MIRMAHDSFGAQLWTMPGLRDTCFEVLTRRWIPEKRRWKLLISWWQVKSWHDPLPLMMWQTIQLTNEQYLTTCRWRSRPAVPEYVAWQA